MENLRQIVKLRANPVADAFEFRRPVTVRIYGTADMFVVVARGRINHLLKGREFLDAEFLETDGIQLDLLCELRDIEHFFFRLSDVAVDEVAMQEEIVPRQDCKRIPHLLLSEAFLKLVEYPVVRGLDSDKENLKACFLCLFENIRMLGDVNSGLDNKGLANIVLDDAVAKLLAPLRICKEVVIAEEHDVSRDSFQFINDRLDRPFGVASFLSERIETERAELAFERAAPC